MTQITIASAHKLAERLQREIDTMQAELVRISNPMTARVASDAQRAIDQRTEFTKGFATLQVMFQASTGLAIKISQANDKIGINSLLKERTYLTKQRAFITGLLRNSKSSRTDAIDQSKAYEYFNRLKDAGSTDSVNILVMAEKPLADMNDAAKANQSRLDSVNDEISRLNHTHTLTLDLPADQMAFLGK